MSNLQPLPDNQTTYMGKPVFISSIDENVEGVEFVSLVDQPAVQYNWMAFSTQQPIKKPQFFADVERRIITGVLMLADTPIYRIDEETGEEYFVVFRKQDIESIVKRFAAEGYHNKVNLMHQQAGKVNGVDAVPGGVYMIESMIVDSSRGVKAPDKFAEVTEGSWIGSYYVESDEVWNDLVKDGTVRGFSVEGMFNMWMKTPAPTGDKFAEIEGLLSVLNELEKMS